MNGFTADLQEVRTCIKGDTSDKKELKNSKRREKRYKNKKVSLPDTAAVTVARGRKVTEGVAETNRAFHYEVDLRSSACEEPPRVVLSARDVL